MVADMFMQLTGPTVNGGSADSVHRALVELTGFTWGVTNIGTARVGGGAGA